VDEDAMFEPGEPAREVALVVLEAASLPRRLAASQQWPSKLAPHEWQVLLAVALGNAASAPEGAQTPRGIARALALTLDDAYDALEALERAGLASIEFHDPETSAAQQEWVLTSAGVAAAVEVVAFAGRVLRWPPPAGVQGRA
jgi:DNA-binding MarR family transcriptional regulator